MLKTLLIVDDDETIRLLLRDEFCDKDYNVVTAVDGEEALVSFYEENIDLVILDLKMPKLNGNEVLNQIRKANKKIPIILYTANPDSIDSLDKNLDFDVVVKSSDISEIINKVNSKFNDKN
jgi:DNA-binding response OmpR family regulator